MMYASQKKGQEGFTLVEMIVAIGLFAVVMLVAVGALLSLTGANRKAQALQSVMNNLDIALDGMVRNIRMGTGYNGSVDCNGNTDGSADDCTQGSTKFSFTPYCDPGATCQDTWTYVYDKSNQYCGVDVICRQEGTGRPWVAITAPEVSIEGVTFYVIGTTPGDAIQPKVLIVVKGEAGGSSSAVLTTFHVEATAVQRELDLQ